MGMIANTFLATGKIAAGVAGHSHALIADGVESIADLLSSVIVWRGLVVADQPADEDHPYGHGKAEPIAAAVVASMLLFAGLWIAATAWREILTPHSTPASFTLIVLFAVIVIKESLFRFVLREANSVESTVVQTDAWHHRSDAITSLAAAVGITVALIGGKGYETADDWAALLASLVIGWNGWKLLRNAGNELMDATPDPGILARIREVALSVPNVRHVEKCKARKMGHHLFVDMHVWVDPRMPVAQAHELAHRIKDHVREKQPSIYDVLIHVEPDGRTEAAPEAHSNL